MRMFLILAMISVYLISSSGFKDPPQYVGDLNIRISAIHYPPFFIISQGKDGNATYSGFCYNIIDLITQLSDLKVTTVPLKSSDIAKYGTSQATVNQLVLSKEVDVIPMIMLPSVERALLMDFTIPLLIGNNRLMLRYPEEESRLTATARPFSLTVWFCLAITAVIMIGTMLIVSLYHNRWNLQSNVPGAYSIPRLLSNNIFLIISIILGQDLDVFFPRRLRSFFRISIGLYCLVAVVICNAYTGTLTSFLMAPRLKPVVQSLKELAESNNYKLTTELNAPFTNTLRRATSGYLKTLGDSLNRNPHLLFLNNSQATENVLKHNAVFIRSSVDILTRISDDIKANNGQCRLTASEPTGSADFFSFPLTKGYPFKPVFDRRLSALWENGLLNHWLKQYTPNVDKCLTTRNRPTVQQRKLSSFKLVEVSSIFLILIVGLLVSILVFVIEYIVFLKSRQNL